LVRRRLLGLLVVAMFPSTAAAAPVLVLGPHGHATVRNDPFVTGPAITPVPVPAALARAHSARARPPQRTVRSELTRLYRAHQISATAYRGDNASFNAALAAERRLRGTRGSELTAVTENLHQIAADGSLTASRLPVLFETLDRNRQWWTTGPLLGSGQRVEFADSDLVWEYYPGQGIELQVLGSFGKADGLYTGGPSDYAELRTLLSELIPLAARRGGGMTWEYYFAFDGGSPPWTSAMSQATGLEALTRAYVAFKDPYYLRVANRALPIFSVRPPVGVNIKTPLGTRYLQYSFAPDADIMNAFLQTLIGLYDYAQVSGDRRAALLFAAGDAQARAEVPHFDTGAWSLYQPGLEDTLDYHTLVTGFLQQLCTRTQAAVYCTTADHFQAYLTTPPVLQLLTGATRVRRATAIRFRLSKYSHVGIVVTSGDQTVFSTSADVPYGVDAFSIPPLTRPGLYAIRLAATDLAGNFDRILGTLKVSR
jgi:D-glucuronyl C5-epimerase C-terminus